MAHGSTLGPSRCPGYYDAGPSPRPPLGRGWRLLAAALAVGVAAALAHGARSAGAGSELFRPLPSTSTAALRIPRTSVTSSRWRFETRRPWEDSLPDQPATAHQSAAESLPGPMPPSSQRWGGWAGLLASCAGCGAVLMSIASSSSPSLPANRRSAPRDVRLEAAVAEGEGESLSARQKRVAITALLALRVITTLWLAICIAGTVLFPQTDQGVVPGMSLLSRATFAAGLIPLLATVNVLLSATRRDRLDGNTFKALNVGLAVLSAGFIVGEYLNPAPFLPPSLRLAFAVGAGVVSWLVGQGHGLPTVKLAVSSPISLASAYAAMSVLLLGTGLGLFVEATLWQANFFIVNYLVGSSTVFTSGSFCVFLAVVMNALQAAAVAGPKRLSSDTYKQLNLSCLASGLWMLLAMAGTLSIGFSDAFTFLVWSAISLGLVAVGGAGYMAGSDYKP
eukprot:EG_transcript_8440